MMISLGQQRPPRGGTPVPRDPPLPDPWDGQYLMTAVILADLIAKHFRSPGQPGRIASVRLADSDIRPDQRFYDVEYQQAAQSLAESFPDTTPDLWYVFLNNYMGYRLVDMPFCSYGKEPDPVTRQCVDKRSTIPPVPEPPIPEPPPIPGVEPQKGMTFDTGLILPLVIGGVGLLVLLGGILGGRR